MHVQLSAKHDQGSPLAGSMGLHLRVGPDGR